MCNCPLPVAREVFCRLPLLLVIVQRPFILKDTYYVIDMHCVKIICIVRFFFDLVHLLFTLT